MRQSLANSPAISLDISLGRWISEQEKQGVNKVAFQQLLCERGYEKDLTTSIRELMFFSPRLLLNSLYECLIQSGAPENQAAHILKSLADHAIEIEKQPTALAHFIWVGPPTQNGNELLGTKSLSKQKPDQPIRLWVLQEHVEAYKEKLTNLRNVTVVSIENYAKKINISFDEAETVTLHSQIEKLKQSAEKKMSAGSAEEKTRGIRDRVSVVDYIKSVIPLYEGGWVFDADILFLQSNQDLLSKPGKWLFPSIFNGRETVRDVWFFYRDKAMNWNINKIRCGAFKAQTKNDPMWQMFLYIYHLVILLVSSKEMPDRERQWYYAGATTMMGGDDRHEFLDSTFIAEMESSLFQDPVFKNLASTWMKENNIRDRQSIRTVSAKVSTGSGDLRTRLNYSLFQIPYYQDSDVNFNFIKRMNQSYIAGNTAPMQFSYLSVETIALFKEIVSILKEFKLCNELWTYASGGIPVGPFITPPIAVESLTALHVCAAMRSEFFEVMLDAIPDDVFYKLCFDEVVMPEEFFNPFCALSEFSGEDLQALLKTLRAGDYYRYDELNRIMFISDNGESALRKHKFYHNDFEVLRRYLENHGKKDLIAKLVNMDSYRDVVKLIEFIIKARPHLIEVMLKKLGGVAHLSSSRLYLNRCELKNSQLSGSLFAGCDFSGTHLLNMTLIACQLTGIIIDEKTTFDNVTIKNNVVCENFYYRPSNYDPLLEFNAADFIEQCQLYYQERLGAVSASNHPILKIVEDDRKRPVEKLFAVFELLSQIHKGDNSYDAFMKLISEKIPSAQSIAIKAYFTRFSPSESSYWHGKNTNQVTISQLIWLAGIPSNSGLFMSGNPDVRRHLMECGVDFTLIENKAIASREKEAYVIQKITDYCCPNEKNPRSSKD